MGLVEQLACTSLTAPSSVPPQQVSERKASLGETQEAHLPHIPSEAARAAPGAGCSAPDSAGLHSRECYRPEDTKAGKHFRVAVWAVPLRTLAGSGLAQLR